ncbi:hypothetical protein QYF61_027967 [Mycteria americana]|uniref:Uncharacterized protein n=1 Tax=Mycteria americana TaxID=33587 RepID=A0AAN7N3D8_MYCAM|nr:hypothetical protein QYF61_027967 [Mycteria americana]
MLNACDIEKDNSSFNRHQRSNFSLLYLTRMVWVGRELQGSSMGRDIFHKIGLLKALSNLTWNTSNDGASTISLGNLLQGLSTFTVKNVFLMFNIKLFKFQTVAPCPCRYLSLQSRLPGTVSRWLLSGSKDGDSTTSLGSLCQCLVIHTGKKCFLRFRRNLLCFSLCPLPLVLSLGTTEKTLALSSLQPPFRVMRFPLRLLFSRLNTHSSLSFSS